MVVTVGRAFTATGRARWSAKMSKRKTPQKRARNEIKHAVGAGRSVPLSMLERLYRSEDADMLRSALPADAPIWLAEHALRENSASRLVAFFTHRERERELAEQAARARAEQVAQARADLNMFDWWRDGAEPTWDMIVALVPAESRAVAEELARHCPCGVSPPGPSRHAVAELYADGFPTRALEAYVVASTTRVSPKDFVQALGVSQPVANALWANRRAHAGLDRLVVMRRDKPERFEAYIASIEAKVAEKERAAAEREREAAEKAAERVRAAAARKQEILATRARLGLDCDEKEARDWLFTAEAAAVLGISEAQARSAGDADHLVFTEVERRRGHPPYRRYDLAYIAGLADQPPEWLQAKRGRRSSRAAAEAARVANSRVRLPVRPMPPARAEVFLGPTNSGKTYQALRYLADRGAGVYAAPLRMLAWEAYEKLAGELGEGEVGLVTGEERLNDKAPVICCTAEMAPISAELLVLDEVQWAADPERGWAWTRLLAGAEVDELYVTGEMGALPLVKAVLGDDVPVTFTERLCPLDTGGEVRVASVPPRSVVVAFSRKAVLHIAGLLRSSGRKVSVLYGALPPEVRRAQIRQFVTGETDVVVATDVIGHGINLPVDHVVFAETDKFDGTARRRLEDWEAAQIAGRAGRYGLSEAGQVHCLAGVPGFTADPGVVRRASSKPSVEVTRGLAGYRKVDFGYVGPSLGDLAADRPTALPAALVSWEKAAEEALAGASWARVQPVGPQVERLKLLSRAKLARPGAPKNVLGALAMDEVWRLSHAPLDPGDGSDALLLVRIGRALAGEPSHFASLMKVPQGWWAEEYEARARSLVGLRWATLAFPGRFDVSHGQVVQAVDKAAELLNKALDRAVEHGVAHCQICGAVCAPWFSECDRCHGSYGGGYWHDDDGYEDYEDYEDYDYDEAEKTRRRKQVDAGIAEAASGNPSLERIANFPRAFWLNEVVPVLSRLSAAEREQKRQAMQKAFETHGHRLFVEADFWGKVDLTGGAPLTTNRQYIEPQQQPYSR